MKELLMLTALLSLTGAAQAGGFRDLAARAPELQAATPPTVSAAKPYQAAPTAVTIYFCGTAITKDWWKAEDAHSPDGSTGFWSPELTSTLFHEQDDASYKLVVNGIGTDDIPGATASPALKSSRGGSSPENKGLFGQAFPSSSLADRGWDQCVDEAATYINSVLAATAGEVTLNLVGHSRGGVLTMLTANRFGNEPRIKAINILALDPVPGDSNIPSDAYSLNGKVKNYVGLYAEDERTGMFEPVIPEAGPGTKVWLLTLPGGHEAMAGNTQKDGHSRNYYYLNLGDGDEHLPELRPVGKLAKLIATGLLGARDWGGVRFSGNGRQGTRGAGAELLRTAQDMRSAKAEKLYEYQRTVSFLPSLVPFYTGLMAYSGGYAQKVSDSDISAGLQNEPRVVYKVEGGTIRTLGLNEAIPDRETAEQLLGELAEFGGLN
ncbi:MAG: hypothetical protein WCK76_09475 [Elusimicrobiota bacterium]